MRENVLVKFNHMIKVITFEFSTLASEKCIPHFDLVLSLLHCRDVLATEYIYYSKCFL